MHKNVRPIFLHSYSANTIDSRSEMHKKSEFPIKNWKVESFLSFY